MFEKRYVPTGNDSGYYAILSNGIFFESCDIGEVAKRMRGLMDNDQIQRSKLTTLLKQLKEVTK